jgi:hypothetical protein
LVVLQLSEMDDDLKGEFEMEKETEQNSSVPPECEQFVERNKSKWIFGRLRTPSALSFWRNVLNVTSVVLIWLTTGYSLPWASELRPIGEFPNHKGTLSSSEFGSHEEFVTKAVSALLENGAVMECNREFLRLVSPLNVVQQRDKLRLIHDLKHLNTFLEWPKFKYESMASLCDILSSEDFMISIDLLSAYHHVALAEEAWAYMGFNWKGRYYYFRVLPFGLGPAPYVFTKVFRPLVVHWRSQGIRTLPYLDDHIFGGKMNVPQIDSNSILYVREKILKDLKRAGWLVSASKVKLVPSQVMTHLGVTVSTVLGLYTVPTPRWDKMRSDIRQVLTAKRVRIKTLSRIAGQIQSFALAMGPVVAFYTRYMYFAIEDRYSWWQFIPIAGLLLRELHFWMSISVSDFRSPIWPQVYKWSVKVNSDAGERGWGAALQSADGVAEARGYMNLCERAKSSTWRELFAILQTLKSFCDLLSNCKVLQWCCDNQGAVYDLCRGGSRVAEIHDLCVQIFEFCRNADIRVLWTWVPREQKDARWADALSKVFDKDDWMLHRGAFHVCEYVWGSHTIDRFASDRNHLCELFNSYYWCPGTAGVDTFAQVDWLEHMNWCNPPFWMIGRLIAFLKEACASATVIVPHWEGSPWWPVLCPDGWHWADFVIEWLELQASSMLFSSRHHSGNTTGCTMHGYRFFAIRISFHPVEDRGPMTRCINPYQCGCGNPPHRFVQTHEWLNA